MTSVRAQHVFIVCYLCIGLILVFQSWGGSSHVHQAAHFMSHRQVLSPEDPIVVFLARTIGNALPPRHHPNQTLKNLEFILKHEVEDVQLRKHWFLNRIFDEKVEKQVLNLLDRYKQSYSIIPFDLNEYAQRDFSLLRFNGMKDAAHDGKFNIRKKFNFRTRVALANIYEPKIMYTMNINEIRNKMIQLGVQDGAEWILPWDQNCFLTPNAWKQLSETLKSNGSTSKYFITYMDRIHGSNDILLNDSYLPNAWEEPQIVFRSDAQERFNETLRYGRGDKVSLLIRLGVPGPWWLEWGWDAYERSLTFHNMSNDVNAQVPIAGWVARLNSGKSNLEKKDIGDLRESKRWLGIENLLKKMDQAVMVQLKGFSAQNLLFFHPDRLSEIQTVWSRNETANNTTNSSSSSPAEFLMDLQYANRILDDALESMRFPLVSVLNKPRPAPSGNFHDFFAPVLVEDSLGIETPPGFIEETDDMFDGVKFQDMLHHTTLVTVAWRISGDPMFFNRALANIDTWFIRNETYVSPHLQFSGVLPLKYRGSPRHGLQYTKYVCFFLDAVRLLHEGGFGQRLPDHMYLALQQWFAQLLKFMTEDLSILEGYFDQSTLTGLYYDLQIAAMAAFVNKPVVLSNTLHMVRSRQITMFHRISGKWLLASLDAHQSIKYREEQRQDDIRQALEAWSVMAQLGKAAGVDIWGYKGDAEHAQSQSILCSAARENIPCCHEGKDRRCSLSKARSALSKWRFAASEALRHCAMLHQVGTCKEIAGMHRTSLVESESSADPFVLPRRRGSSRWRKDQTPHLRLWGALSRIAIRLN